jgi:hypothetical protein
MQVKIPARDMILEVELADAVTYQTVGALNTITVNKGENEETEDVTTYDSDGAYEERVMQRGASLTLAGFMHKDNQTGAQDPGQARIEELSDKTLEESIGKVRFRHPTDTEWTVWNATFRLTEQGGPQNANTTWGATIRRSGKSTKVAVS